MNKLIFLFLIIGCISCSNTETIEVKNDAGIVTEIYERNKKDFAKEGLYKAFDANGKLMEEAMYKNDTLEGQRKFYYENGNIQAEEIYVNGVFDGEWKGYYKDGKPELQGNYVKNKMVGTWKRFYSEGQLMEEVTFADNNENGPFTEYYANGNLKAEGSYLGGDNENGELKLYNEAGELERKMNCESGRCNTTWRSEALIKKEAEEALKIEAEATDN